MKNDAPTFNGYDPATLESFFAQVKGRMEKGQREYGDESFSKSPERLAIELCEELEDQAGWAFVSWVRMRETIRRMRLLSSEGAELGRRTDAQKSESADLDRRIEAQKAHLAHLEALSAGEVPED